MSGDTGQRPRPRRRHDPRRQRQHLPPGRRRPGNYLAFNYDNTYGADRSSCAPPSCSTTRRADRITTRPAAALDIGAADEIHGESGDDFIYGRSATTCCSAKARTTTSSAATATTGSPAARATTAILGDDGRIYTSRNSTTLGEPLYGIAPIPGSEINTIITNPSGTTIAIINVGGAAQVHGGPDAGQPRSDQRRADDLVPRAPMPTTSSTADWATTRCTAAQATTRSPGPRR